MRVQIHCRIPAKKYRKHLNITSQEYHLANYSENDHHKFKVQNTYSQRNKYITTILPKCDNFTTDNNKFTNFTQ